MNIKNCKPLKYKIADKIFILNKYIMLILIEKRESPINIAHLFDRKVFLTSLFAKIKPGYEAADTLDLALFKKKLSDIAELDASIINILKERKDYTADKISSVIKLSAAVKAYTGVSAKNN
jgi:hypothetical protein